jgi:hypothetical protein
VNFENETLFPLRKRKKEVFRARRRGGSETDPRPATGKTVGIRLLIAIDGAECIGDLMTIGTI